MKKFITFILIFCSFLTINAQNFIYFGAPSTRYLVNIKDSVLTAKTYTPLGNNIAEHTYIINHKNKQLCFIVPEYSCKEKKSGLEPTNFIKYDTIYVDMTLKNGARGDYYSIIGYKEKLNLGPEKMIFANTKHKVETGNIIVTADVYNIGDHYTTVLNSFKEQISVRDFYLCYIKKTPENNYMLFLNDINLLSVLNNYINDDFRNRSLQNKTAKLIQLD